MEDLRNKLTASADLFVLKGGQARKVPKPTPVSTQPCPICGQEFDAKDNLGLNAHIDLCLNKDVIKQASTSAAASPGSTSVITISSPEPSPVISRQRQPSSRPSNGIITLSDSDEDSSDEGPRAPTRSTKSVPKRLVWSDDEDEDEDEEEEEQAPPIPKPSVPALIQTKIPFKNPPTVIKAPTNAAPARPKVPRDGPLWETFDDPTTDNLYDPKKSAAEAERDLQDLLKASMNDAVVDIDERDAIVNGFQDGIKLLPHQVIGRKWMAERESGKKAGGILADDMGLGKTIQTLTRIVDGRPRKADKYDGYSASTIVVCPVSLVSQWASEIHKMAVGLRVIQHHGPSRTTDPDTLKKAHVIITSYSVLSSEYSAYEDSQQNSKSKPKSKSKSKNSSSSEDSDSSDEPIFGRTVAKKKKAQGKQKAAMDALFHINWWRIVLDEAHNIKNRKTKAAIACCALRGKYRWALTGTPMQNNVEELFSLLNFLRIRPLNDWETFNNQINKPVKSGKSVRAMKRLQVVLKAIMLRRKKDSHLNGEVLIKLPERIVDIVTCAFDEDEREFYESIATKVELTLNKYRQSGDIAKNYTSVLVLLLRLRQACNHPSLLSKEFTVDKEAVEPHAAKNDKDLEDADDLADLFGQMDVAPTRKCQMCQQVLSPENSKDFRSANYCADCEVLAKKSMRKSIGGSGSGSLSLLPPDSAKIRKMMEILNEIRDRPDEEKTIVFSQFTSMLDLIQPFLRHGGFRYVRYDGSMRKDQREESLRMIKEDKDTKIILISFKAGSTGLNLTSCNNVILVDMWWNPALEDQAFDRAHRYGQERNVNIYKLTIEQTVEERILALQDKKRELAAAALSGDKLKNSRLGLNELMELFRPGGRDEEDDDGA